MNDLIRSVFVVSIFWCVFGLERHPCQRPCDGATTKTCTYTFTVERYLTMSKACYGCPQNLTDCHRPHCIPADGVQRGITVINRQLPGPLIDVCQGDRIVVDVRNRLAGESCSIHWHGLHMDKTPYMDGVPMVTQCPISPASTFRYSFVAGNPGTHFYHSHTGLQRADGVYGALIVRQSHLNDPHFSLYDFDLPEHVILVADWMDVLSINKFTVNLHKTGNDIPTSLLINGKGRQTDSSSGLFTNVTMHLATFSVRQGFRYRFRIVSNGVLDCPVQVSVDNHTMLVIASDGEPVHPVEIDSLVITGGERYDFVLEANQSVSSYWMRFRGLMDWNTEKLFQAAILRYEEAAEEEPKPEITFNTTNRTGIVLNPVNMAPGDADHITVAELKSANRNNYKNWTRTPDHTFILASDFYAVNNSHFHDPVNYPFSKVRGHHKLHTPQINRISLKMPPFPLLSQPSLITPDLLCNETTVSNCTDKQCECTYALQIPLGSLVELILIDEGFTFDATHPFHLHGSNFRVVAMGRIGSNVRVDYVKAMDRQGSIRRNLINAPIKDTVVVPDGGYTIVRFVADNPGYWLFHCHLAFHMEVGMGLIFKVGTHEEFPPVPKNFPTCGDWLGDVDDEAASRAASSRVISYPYYLFLVLPLLR